MSSDLLDEIISINSIYTPTTLSALPSSAFHTLTLPSLPSTSLRLEFPPDYPSAPPSILGTESLGDDIPKGSGAQIVDVVRKVLAEVYIPGEPVIFTLIEEFGERFSQLGWDAGDEAEGQEEAPARELGGRRNGQDSSSSQLHQGDIETDECDDDTQLPSAEDNPRTPPPWILSSVITEKKSAFVARAAPVTSVSQAKTYIAHLLATDKKVSKATHNITAWRIPGPGDVKFQDCDDDGETAAGGRLLHLLEMMGVWGVVVVVSRWYGGVQLGPDRFRIINSVGREAVLGVEEGRRKAKEGEERERARGERRRR